MNSEVTNSSKLDQLASVLKVLGEPNRLLLLNKIMEGIQCNCELGKSLSLSANLVSHHLAVLCDSGLVNAKRDEDDGRWIYYSINEATFDQIKMLFIEFFDKTRIQPCKDICGPKNPLC